MNINVVNIFYLGRGHLPCIAELIKPTFLSSFDVILWYEFTN